LPTLSRFSGRISGSPRRHASTRWRNYAAARAFPGDDIAEDVLKDLKMNALAWVASRPAHDQRTPTEIANGITDLMPTRIRTVLERKPRTMHRRADPGSGLDCCIACGKKASAFDHKTEQYTYDDALYADSTYRCTGLVIASGNAPVAREAYEDLLKYTRLIEARHDALKRELDSSRTTLRRVEQNNELGKLIAAVDAPVPMIMHCPGCRERHIDVAFADHPHHTHACQHCGFSWRPAVVNTVGVQFLPGFKDEEK